MKSFRLFFISAISISTLYSTSASALTLEEYLYQVKNNNSGYSASMINSEAANLLSKKSLLLTTPNLFASAQTGFEKQNQAVAVVRYKEVQNQNYSVGVEQNFPFGVNSKLYYNLNRNAFEGLTSTTTPPIVYQTNPVLDLVVPLWQDRFGAALRANRDAIFFDNQAQRFNSKFDAKSFEIESEKLYWQLVTAMQIVKISEESLKQSEAILQRAKKQARMNLGERADVLQAEADVGTKKLQLQQAQNDVKIAARNFNQNRYVSADTVDEKLEDVDFNYLTKFQIDRNISDLRDDVKAVAASSKALVARAKIEEENNKPKLDAYGSYGFNGLETRKSDSINGSLSQKGDEAFIGVRFSVPIAIGLQSDIRSAARANAAAARMNYRQEVVNQETDWQNLLQNIEGYQENLRLSLKIEEMQKSKLANEKNLLASSRTSTYQVLLFEQDYNQSRINTIRNAYQLLSLIAEKKLYQDN